LVEFIVGCPTLYFGGILLTLIHLYLIGQYSLPVGAPLLIILWIAWTGNRPGEREVVVHWGSCCKCSVGCDDIFCFNTCCFCF
jgi:hypothetical protein